MRSPFLALAASGVLLVSGCATVPAAAESEREAVLATVQGFFDWIEFGEPARAAATVLPEAAFINLRAQEGGPVVQHFTMAESLARRGSDTRALREAIVGEPTVLIEGDLATVWCHYTFHIDGKLSHTGVDSFSLLRTRDGWRVAGGCYTVVKPAP